MRRLQHPWARDLADRSIGGQRIPAKVEPARVKLPFFMEILPAAQGRQAEIRQTLYELEIRP